MQRTTDATIVSCLFGPPLLVACSVCRADIMTSRLWQRCSLLLVACSICSADILTICF